MRSTLHNPISIAPFITFRILFGALCFFGLLWSVAKNELAERYFDTDFHFKYWGFEWLPYPGDNGVVILYILAAVGALGIAFGAFYRLSVILFALSFSYKIHRNYSETLSYYIYLYN